MVKSLSCKLIFCFYHAEKNNKIVNKITQSSQCCQDLSFINLQETHIARSKLKGYWLFAKWIRIHIRYCECCDDYMMHIWCIKRQILNLSNFVSLLIFWRKQITKCRQEVKNKPKEGKTSTNSQEIMIDIFMKSIRKSSSIWITL